MKVIITFRSLYTEGPSWALEQGAEVTGTRRFELTVPDDADGALKVLSSYGERFLADRRDDGRWDIFYEDDYD